MIISLNSIEYDEVGDVTFDSIAINANDSSRRVSRVKTLDGGCVLVDGGYTDADKTFNIDILYDETTLEIIEHLHQDKTLIYMSANGNFYSCVISLVRLSQETEELIRLTILIKEKLN